MQALLRLESRAVSLLLKDLGKAGESERARELFDSLRALEREHALSGLCDVYTYTAAIALCIHQQVCRPSQVFEVVGLGPPCEIGLSGGGGFWRACAACAHPLPPPRWAFTKRHAASAQSCAVDRVPRGPHPVSRNPLQETVDCRCVHYRRRVSVSIYTTVHCDTYDKAQAWACAIAECTRAGRPFCERLMRDCG